MKQKSIDILEQIKNTNKRYILGVDECGTGSLIGDARVVAFLALKDWNHPGVNDSKKLSEKQRNEVYEELFWLEGVQFDNAIIKKEDIDTLGLGAALKNGYRTAIEKVLADFNHKDDVLIVIDGILKVNGIEHLSLPKADSLIPHVSAASILCKVARDHYVVRELHHQYPEYNWAKNKGYASQEHKDAIKKHGLSPFHRNYKLKGISK